MVKDLQSRIRPEEGRNHCTMLEGNDEGVVHSNVSPKDLFD